MKARAAERAETFECESEDSIIQRAKKKAEHDIQLHDGLSLISLEYAMLRKGTAAHIKEAYAIEVQKYLDGRMHYEDRCLVLWKNNAFYEAYFDVFVHKQLEMLWRNMEEYEKIAEK